MIDDSFNVEKKTICSRLNKRQDVKTSMSKWPVFRGHVSIRQSTKTDILPSEVLKSNLHLYREH